MGRSGARPLLLCSPHPPPLSQSVSPDDGDDNYDDNVDDNGDDNDDDNGDHNVDDNDIIIITKSCHYPHSAPLSQSVSRDTIIIVIIDYTFTQVSMSKV